MRATNNDPAQGEKQDFLSEHAEVTVEYQYATQGQRFLNWLIDNVLMNYGLSYLTGFALGYLLSVIAPEYLFELVYEPTTWDKVVVLYLTAILNYILYYSLCEKLFRGYTLGKLITGTRAIRQDGNELTVRDAFLRSTIRLVPFEAFSGFNTLAWHDQWSRTMVVKSR